MQQQRESSQDTAASLTSDFRAAFGKTNLFNVRRARKAKT